ncbi:MAG: 4-hydroxythreonine-4-phosphate dehydrogenase PdxA [Clostridia bacterium]
MDHKKPILAITMGDPSGIGPEICARALLNADIRAMCCPVLIGDLAPLETAMRLMHITDTQIHVMNSIEEADFAFDGINLLDLGIIKEGDCPLGQVSALAGHCAFCYVEKAIQLAMHGQVDGTVTAPLNKEALHLAGHMFAGHTEIYAHFTGSGNYSMMLAHQRFRVAHVSTHVSLRQACDNVQKERVLSVILLANNACKDFGIPQPRIAVAGLNPHSGEGGLFGKEEIEQIIPAIEEAKALGLCVEGPIPPDTVFSKLNGGMYDICVAMYHDQGHIPVKLLGFTYDEQKQQWNTVSGVNITLGLPIIRVAVDHGTAFDIAGKGIASDESLRSAIGYATQMSIHQSKNTKRSNQHV